MSNALARKKKRMQPLGYSKSELIGNMIDNPELLKV